MPTAVDQNHAIDLNLDTCRLVIVNELIYVIHFLWTYIRHGLLYHLPFIKRRNLLRIIANRNLETETEKIELNC